MGFATRIISHYVRFRIGGPCTFALCSKFTIELILEPLLGNSENPSGIVNLGLELPPFVLLLFELLLELLELLPLTAP